MDIVVATNNKHKLLEIKDILSPLGYNILSLNDVNINIDPEETGATFDENAMIKAFEIAKHVDSKIVIADDSGICVDALDGAPGVYSKRFSGEDGDDKRNNEKLLSLLKDISNRTARFVCSICCVMPDKSYFIVSGEFIGEIAKTPTGENGFGYDPLMFIPEYNKTVAQLEPNIKNKISHRANALIKLKERLSSVNV